MLTRDEFANGTTPLVVYNYFSVFNFHVKMLKKRKEKERKKISYGAQVSHLHRYRLIYDKVIHS